MTTANKITLIRLALVPVFIVLLWSYGNGGKELLRWLALTIFIIAIFTDCLDGYVAARFGQRTQLGAMLDPIADKLLLVLGLVILSQNNRPYLEPIPSWLIGVVFGRDVVLLIGMITMYYNGEKMVKVVPHLLGKISTVLQMTTIAITLLKVPATLVFWSALGAMVTTALSGIIYMAEGLRRLNPPQQNPDGG